ncbi:MFS transporter [Candidiatus Paracoxiella cheracis]|uniref:MFS transporter n=1 Tax=Candidiatus Paracoxiella cheracis TaxID=3405120 RepID=UPI003BF5AA1B
MPNDQTNTASTASSLILPFIICVLAALFYVYDYFIQVAPSVMTEQLMRSFSIGAGDLGILSASFFYSYTLMQIPSGLFIDRFGARIILTFAVLISALGVLIFGLSHLFAWAAVARFLIGVGSSCAYISAIFLVARWFPHRHFAMIAGLLQLAACVGSIFGQAPLALTINHFGWRHVMVMTGVITFVLGVIYWVIIRDGRKPATSEAHNVVMKNERQRLSFLTQRSQVWWVAVCGLASWVPVGVVGALWGVPYLMKIYGWNNVVAGQICSLFWVGVGIGSPLAGWYSNRIASRKKPFMICFLLAIFSSIVIVHAPFFSPWIIGAALFLLGVSAAVQSLTFSVIKDIVPPAAFGTASGLTNMLAILGSGVSQTLVGFFIHSQWNGARFDGIPVYSINDYQHAFYVLIAAGILGLLVTWFKVKETHAKITY